jgi:murein DD-endopeptidase MepM/ murein hydrolase activator NlpD
VTGDLLPAHGADPADVVIRKIVLPVQRSFSYSDDFGDPRSGGRTHEGNDLMVPKLRPLLAAADARVRRITIDDGANEGNTPRGRAPTSTSRSTSPTAPR